ncbi:MAG: sugar phosphate nucleotidyltransferase [Sphaerobacter sp.]|nr:sugar phosphate nucleotidyltransferase [Sphaerobacter sp.]
MNVIIPVAGLGTRLRPQTWSKPKPLVTVAGKPVLGHVLDSLLQLPLDQVVFVTGYLGEQIEDYVRTNYTFPATFVEQEEPLGQSHAVLQARDVVTGPSLIVFPDMLFEADLAQVEQVDADGALFVKEVPDPRRFGVVVVDDGRITRLVEKPADAVSNLAIVGIYYFRAIEDLFEAIEYQMAHSIQTKGEYFLADAIQHLIDRGKRFTWLPVSVWEDCGKPEALLDTNRYMLTQLGNHVPDIPGSVIVPPVVIDPTATIKNSIIGPYASIGARVTITNSIVTDSIVDEEAQIETAMLTRSIVGRHAYVRGNSVRVNVGDSSNVILTGWHENGANERD